MPASNERVRREVNRYTVRTPSGVMFAPPLEVLDTGMVKLCGTPISQRDADYHAPDTWLREAIMHAQHIHEFNRRVRAGEFV